MLDAVLSGSSGALLMDISATDIATMIQNGIVDGEGLQSLGSFGFDILESGGEVHASEALSEESDFLRDMADWVELVEY